MKSRILNSNYRKLLISGILVAINHNILAGAWLACSIVPFIFCALGYLHPYNYRRINYLIKLYFMLAVVLCYPWIEIHPFSMDFDYVEAMERDFYEQNTPTADSNSETPISEQQSGEKNNTTPSFNKHLLLTASAFVVFFLLVSQY